RSRLRVAELNRLARSPDCRGAKTGRPEAVGDPSIASGIRRDGQALELDRRIREAIGLGGRHGLNRRGDLDFELSPEPGDLLVSVECTNGPQQQVGLLVAFLPARRLGIFAELHRWLDPEGEAPHREHVPKPHREPRGDHWHGLTPQLILSSTPNKEWMSEKLRANTDCSQVLMRS